MRERFPTKEIVTGLVGTVALYELSKIAFSYKVRKQIAKRDNHQCVSCGETEYLEAAHINHNKRNRRYNHPSNGRLLCICCHLEDHQLREGRNGLSKRNNRNAIDSLKGRMKYLGFE